MWTEPVLEQAPGCFGHPLVVTKPDKACSKCRFFEYCVIEGSNRHVQLTKEFGVLKGKEVYEKFASDWAKSIVKEIDKKAFLKAFELGENPAKKWRKNYLYVACVVLMLKPCFTFDYMVQAIATKFPSNKRIARFWAITAIQVLYSLDVIEESEDGVFTRKQKSETKET